MVWKALQHIRGGLKLLGAVCLMGMTLLTCADVIGRYLGHPIFGSVELVGFMATMAVAFALPYTHEVRGHIGVEILVQNFSKRTQAIIDIVTNSIALAFFVIVAWRMTVYARTIQKSGEVSMNLEFPEYTIIFVTAFCFLVFCLTIVEDLLTTIRQLPAKQ